MKIYKIKYPDKEFFTQDKSPEKKKFTKQYLIKILKEEYDLKVKMEDFAKNENGKPYLKNSNLFFNLSHSNKYMIIAFSNSALGVDIEEVREIDFKSLSKRFFCPEENEFILNSEDKQNAFFRMWTLKESYIKWKGGRLPRDLQKFRIEILEDEIFAYEANQKVDKLFIKEYRLGTYYISVCSEEKGFPEVLIDFE